MTLGTSLHGFVIEKILDLPEFKSQGILARHEKTGAKVFHTLNSDEENLFAFIFKTIPETSNGVAHILEHTVLCGSEAFPVKDPFLLLLKGSMQTFLNAFTYPDKTVYPGASTVKKDLFNLMEVYGDAVFFPLLKEDLFRQEGHRLEFDSEGNLIRTGIVYNEMKGNYSTHDSVAGDWCYRALFPDTSYANDSGGDPAVIPELTYEDFKEFHRTYYHPSNALIYLYGDTPTEEYLEFLDRRFLSRFSPIVAPPPIPLQTRWTEPKRVEVSYPAGDSDDEETHTSVTLNWLLFPIEEVFRTLSWEVLTEILMGTPASPLQKLAAVTDLGEDLSSPSGFETELRQTVFSVGLQGADRHKASEIETLFLQELQRIVNEGINTQLIEGTLRRFEFRSREIKGGGPFGLRLLRKIGRGWLHGLSPEETLIFEPYIQRLRNELDQNPRYFEQLIQEDLLDNPHRTTTVVYPDSEQNQREIDEERQGLEELLKSQPLSFKDRVSAAQKALEEFQSQEDRPEDIATIPFLSVDQIPKKVDSIETERKSDDFYQFTGFTNGISYLDLGYSLSHLSPEEQMLVPLWTSFMPVAGIPGKDYEQVSRDLSMVCGGFSSYAEVHAGLDLYSGARALRGTKDEKDQSPVHTHVFFRIKSLDSTLHEALGLIAAILTEPDFTDLNHVSEVFFEMRNDMRSSILPAGSSYASLRAELGLHPAQGVEERFRGLTQYMFLENLAEAIAEEKKANPSTESSTLLALSEALQALTAKIFSRGKPIMNLTADIAQLPSAHKGLSALRDTLNTSSTTLAGHPSMSSPVIEKIYTLGRKARDFLSLPQPPETLELLTYPSKVSYAAAAIPSAVLGTPEQAFEALLAHILKTGPLWEEIRMKGGAYGAHAASDGMAGIFSFASYRDPHTTRTLKAFEEALVDLSKDGLDLRTLDLAKIGCISKELKPLSPGEKGMVGFKRLLYGIDTHLRQRRRDLMLGAREEDLQNSAERLALRIQTPRVAILGGPDVLEPLKDSYKGGTITRILGR